MSDEGANQRAPGDSGAVHRPDDVLQGVRAVADAVLYEGYLLYPYRSTSAKNQVRWQFGVLSPPHADQDGLGEPAGMRVQIPLRSNGSGSAQLTVHLRFLHVQARIVERSTAAGFVRVEQLDVAGTSWLSWDEAVVEELTFGPLPLAGLDRAITVDVPGGEDVELVPELGRGVAGRVVRRREPLHALLHLHCDRPDPDGDVERLTVTVQNLGAPAHDRADATHRSFAGTHLLLEAAGASFVSVIDPPEDARTVAAGCHQDRCWPVLAGKDGGEEVVLAAPIILYDHPEIASQSAGDLFDATEIDEILTLRVMTMTEQEKAEARATDPRAAAIIDRCDAMSPQDLQQLHGVLRNPYGDPHAGRPDPGSPLTGDDWWQAEAAAEVSPETDVVMVSGVAVTGGSLVRLRPSRRADAQDMFLAGRTARVSAVHTDLDGATHVAVTVIDDPAADLHDWYGRHLFFAPDELEPLDGHQRADGQQRPEEEI